MPRPTAPRARRLAASFVVTVATVATASGLSACQSSGGTTGSCQPPDCHMNPPPLPPQDASAPDLAPPSAAPTKSAAPTATVAASAAPSAVATTAVATTADALPAAPDGAKLCSATNRATPCIDKSDDGECRMLNKPTKCPPGVACNPPPPRRVKCP